MATHSSILARRIPWTEEPGGLQSIGCQSQRWLKWLSTQSHAYYQTHLSLGPTLTPGSMGSQGPLSTENVIGNMHTCMLSHFSHVWLFAPLWIVVCQAFLSMEFSRQEYWSELPFPPSGNLPNPGIEPESLMNPALAGGFFLPLASLGSPHCQHSHSYLIQGWIPQTGVYYKTLYFLPPLFLMQVPDLSFGSWGIHFKDTF